MDALLLINPRSGDGAPSADELHAAAVERGIETHLLAEGEDADEIARASSASVLGMAGGDGSMARVAKVAIERGTPFMPVPSGTLNHFARDLGLEPGDPLGALEAFHGVERRVDVGRVNGRVFLNNVSFGAYARAVHEHHRGRRRLDALVAALRRADPIMAVEGEEPARLILVSNNSYRLEPAGFGERERLDAGLLHLYQARGLLAGTWSQREGPRFRIVAPKPLEAAIDGEPARLDPPVEFTIEPGALRVLVPRDPGR